MKGIVLAGGSGTRLHPLTVATSKQLLPVYDKPLIHYPLGAIMLAGIREILLISTPSSLPQFHALLGDGAELGIRITYAEQSRPRGIADAFLVGREFLDGHPCALALGDNLLHGDSLGAMLQAAREHDTGSTAFAYHVQHPERYGVVEFDADGRAVSIEEKPTHPRSHWALTGLYFFDRDVVDIAASLHPSPRGELEITDVQKVYLAAGRLRVERLGRGFAWLDAGTPASLLESGNFVRMLQERQGLRIGCLQEIAFRMSFIDRPCLLDLASRQADAGLAAYLRDVAGADGR